MEYKITLYLQKCLFFNVYVYVVWLVVTAFFLYVKLDKLDHLSKYLSIAVYTILFIVETTRLYFAHYGNLSSRVPELAGFLMLSILMQMPLVSFFLFNPFLLSTPTEYTLHTTLWVITMLEIIIGFVGLKQASSIAKSIYISNIRETKY